jgi:hypothetical protein
MENLPMADYSKLGSAATSVAKGAHAAIGAPAAPSWGGYWNWVSATVIIAFMLYTAQKGTLNTWVSFFGWNPQAAPTTTSATATTSSTGAAGQTGVAGAVNSAVNSTSVGKTISQLFGLPPLTIGGSAGTWLNGLFGGGSSSSVPATGETSGSGSST